MALQPTSHNSMLDQIIPHPESTNFDENGESSSRPHKRQRTGHNSAFPRAAKPSIPNSDVESDDEDLVHDSPAKTGLEAALPEIRIDQEAIDEYEAQRTADHAERHVREGRLRDQNWTKGKSSIYVDAFNLALETVLDEENHLFDDAEKALFGYWRKLGYEAQYLYVRLFLRKTSAWHRIRSLGYYSDVANLDAAIEQLQHTRMLPASEGVQNNPGEVEPPVGTCLGDSFTFADKSEREITTLEEASSLLRLDELKTLAKDIKVQGRNKKELLINLRQTSRQQTSLRTVRFHKSDTESSVQSTAEKDDGAATPRSDDDGAATPRPADDGAATPRPADDGAATPRPDDDGLLRPAEGNRDAHFLRKILDETGPYIRLSSAPLKLFERVHLVFYRSTEWTEKSLTTIILARIERRNFPKYVVSRSANIFPSRSLLLEFEASLRTQFRIDNILEFNGPPTAEELQNILDIHSEVHPRWHTLLDEEERKESKLYQSGEGAYLRRLSPAWVYTRIVHKVAYVFGKLKQHKKEHELLTELLRQRLFHHARRGGWYDRKALLEEHYMHALMSADGRTDDRQKKHWKRIALETCEDGLQDPLTHLAYHYDIQKRLKKLEKALNIPKRAQHDFSHVRLAAPTEVTIYGIRVERESHHPTSASTRESRTVSHHARPGARTVWIDPVEGNGECSVEAMCLSRYRRQGWKGYHTEGGIVRTLFAYLFYDILFTYVPNVFQTAFQTCPLDLHTDAFYPTRVSEINVRLAEISNGMAKDMVKKIWEEHHERNTCIVGLDWSFELDDLLEIAELFPAGALATVCKVMAQEYGERGGGIPDLFLWHTESGQVKFAEVKSENDRLSDTQRLWIHVLTGAGITVELANAVATEVKKLPAK